MASEEKYPQIWFTDSTIKIKVKDDDQAREIRHSIERTCRFITVKYPPPFTVFPEKEELILCGGNFYLTRYDKDEKVIEIKRAF